MLIITVFMYTVQQSQRICNLYWQFDILSGADRVVIRESGLTISVLELELVALGFSREMV